MGIRIDVVPDDEVTDESRDLGMVDLNERDKDMVCIQA
jgi:hypothetical protein